MAVCAGMVVITGASSGIGVAAAVEILRGSDKFVLPGRAAGALQRAVRRVRRAGR
ncbi:hypothetical protein GCM10010166_29660 [Couchioplanes caeruleus subsp. azureus]|nr:hypothetical protein GCM10010166_29660 [Couchioplanes caeruleus subsp. azureus]